MTSTKVVTLKLSGEFDIARVDELRALLPLYDLENVILDLRDCRYIDSSTLAELARLRRARTSKELGH